MPKVRVYELAKKLGVTSSVVLNEIVKLGMGVKNNLSGLEPEIVKKIEDALLKKDVEPLKEDVLAGQIHTGEPSNTSMLPEPEIEKTDVLLISEQEEGFNGINQFKGEIGTEDLEEIVGLTIRKNSYCPVCNERVEKYGRRKDDLKIPGWIFCPKHGWFRYRPEKEQHETNVSDDKNLKDESLTSQPEKRTGNNKITVIGLIISAVIVAVLITINFSFLKSSVSKIPIPDINFIKKIVHREQPAVHYSPAIPELPKVIVAVNETTETTKDIKEESPQPSKPSMVLFTVQVGAFSDLSHAKAIKRKLVNKGYNAYITISESKTAGKLYKVCIGKFSDKGKAESLSTKIKKTERLQTFVTSS